MTTITTTEKQPKKASSVRHTRAIQRDRTKRPLAAPPDEQVRNRTRFVNPHFADRRTKVTAPNSVVSAR